MSSTRQLAAYTKHKQPAPADSLHTRCAGVIVGLPDVLPVAILVAVVVLVGVVVVAAAAAAAALVGQAVRHVLAQAAQEVPQRARPPAQ